MKFQSGILGVIVVVIALTGTVFGGFILNVNSEFTTTTDYTDVTDVTSLYSFNSQPDYLDYNPAKNFTGYKLSNNSGSGIDYTQSSTMNQYYMGSTSGTSEVLDLSSLYTETIAPNSGYTFLQYWVYSGDSVHLSGMYDPMKVYPDRIPFKDLIPLIENRKPANTTSITINVPNTSGVNYYHWYGASGSDFVHDGKDFTGYVTSRLNAFSPDDNLSPYLNNYTFFQNSQISYSWDVGSPTVNVNFNGVYNLSVNTNSPYAGLMQSSQNMVYASYSAPYTVTPISFGSYGDYRSSNEIEIVYNTATTYYYMNPSQGVSINNTSAVATTNWTNDKTNGIVSLVFGNEGRTCSNEVVTSVGDSITISSDGSSNTIRVNSQTAHNIGSWDHFVLNINGREGKVTAVPIIDFVNYQSFTTADYVYDVGTITTSPFTTLKWSGTTDSFKFSVYNTNVQMTTKLLMVDPTLNIKNYFPLEEGFKIEMDSFTVLGDSITINGVTYYGDSNGNPISSTGNIFISNVDDYGVSIKLDSVSIIEDAIDNHTYIQSNDYGSPKYDLGETTTSIISASGTWFFTNELWEGDIVLKSVYVWDWANNFTSTQSIIIWIGLIVVGSLIAHRFFDFGALDLAIVVASTIILYSILGVF